MASQPQNPLSNQVVVEVLADHVEAVEDMANFRLVNKQWLNAIWRKWRESAELQIISYEPVSFTAEEVETQVGCYNALFLTTSEDDTQNELPLPTKLEKMPFQRYHLANFTEDQLPPNENDPIGRAFWRKFGSKMKHVRVSCGKNLSEGDSDDDTDSDDEDEDNDENKSDFVSKVIQTVLNHCDNLEQLHIQGEKTKNWGRMDWGSLAIMDEGELIENENYFKNRHPQTVLSKLTRLSLSAQRASELNAEYLFCSPDSINKLLNVAPNLKHFKFISDNSTAKYLILAALKAAKEELNLFWQLESLEFEGHTEKTVAKLLEYLQTALPPLKTFQDGIVYSEWVDNPDQQLILNVLETVEGTITNLDLTVKGYFCKEDWADYEQLPLFPNFGDYHNFSQLTCLSLAFHYARWSGLVIFNFGAFRHLPNLKEFLCEWKWIGFYLDQTPPTSRSAFYQRWNDSLTSLPPENLPILPSLTKFHLNIPLNATALWRLSSWAKNLKILNTLLDDDVYPQLIPSAWPALYSFYYLPESTTWRRKNTVFIKTARQDVDKGCQVEARVGWWTDWAVSTN